MVAEPPLKINKSLTPLQPAAPRAPVAAFGGGGEEGEGGGGEQLGDNMGVSTRGSSGTGVSSEQCGSTPETNKEEVTFSSPRGSGSAPADAIAATLAGYGRISYSRLHDLCLFYGITQQYHNTVDVTSRRSTAKITHRGDPGSYCTFLFQTFRIRIFFPASQSTLCEDTAEGACGTEYTRSTTQTVARLTAVAQLIVISKAGQLQKSPTVGKILYHYSYWYKTTPTSCRQNRRCSFRGPKRTPKNNPLKSSYI